MEKLKMQTKNKVEVNIETIGNLFPNTITERIKGYDENNKPIIEKAIDFDILKQELSKIIVEGKEERYQMNWPGKKEAILKVNSPINKTLRPCRKESIDFDKTENLYIEGDNLEVLKLLQETYLNEVKMIYIDPPYNTGNDSFVYNDDFAMSSEEFSEVSNQYDENGNMNYDMRKNSESNGKFHTDWLNMMYPRLKLAKDLLSEEGVIFISIDDNEVENLKKICNEIFGEDNFVAQLIWKSRQNKDNRNLTGVSIDHEYILVYSKDNWYRAFKGGERNLEAYKNPDNDSRGDWTSANMVGLLPEDQRPNCHYDLINPDTGINYGKPNMGWRYDKSTMNRLINEKRIIWPSSQNGRPRRKVFLNELSDSLPGYSSIIGEDIYTRNGTLEIQSIFNSRCFDFPKNSKLIKDLAFQSTKKDSIILDFFSGSATTAHAVMQLNAEDGGNRKFIMVQLPELTYEKSEAFKAGYENICEIGKERIRRAGKKIKEENPDKIDNLDTGFRVLKLDSSNMKDVFYNSGDYEQTLLDNVENNIKEDRSSEDLLFQVMLDLGELLSSDIEEIKIEGKKVFNVGQGNIVACFDDNIINEVVTEIAKVNPFYAVFRDGSLSNDSVATNFEQIFKTYSPNTIRKVL